MTVHSFFEYLTSVNYIHKVTLGAFYFVDYTLRPTFTFVDIFYLECRWKKTVTLPIHEILGKYSPPDFCGEVSVK